MTTPTKRLQIKIPLELSAAIRRVAASELRTEHACVLNILRTAPSLQAVLKEELARLPEKVVDAFYEAPAVKESPAAAPKRTAGDYTDAERAKAAAEWRP